MNTLIFDTATTGHHSEYIGHLVDFLYDASAKGNHYYFVVHTEFSEKFPEIANKAKTIENLNWIEITPAESETFKGGSIWKSYANYRIMDAYANKLKVDHVCSLDFAAVKYGSIPFRTSYTLSGIMFTQFYRLKTQTLSEKWAYFKRYAVTHLNMLNKKFVRIFVLNDSETVAYMNRKFRTDVFKMLPDPIPHLDPLPNFDIYRNYDIEKSRKIYLHIGSLGERKGTYEVIDSAPHMKVADQKKIAVLLAGKASSEPEKEQMLAKIEKARIESKTQIVWDATFVPTEQMKSLFDQCHAVLIPYKNAEYSSGILGHAAAANKIVIATNAGLLERIVMKYRLGLLVDPPSAPQIGVKMVEALTYMNSPNSNQDFVKEHDPKIFAKMVLEI